MRIVLFVLLFQSIPLENVYYGPAQPCCEVMYQSWGRMPSGCAAEIETGVISCGTALPTDVVQNLSVSIQ